MALSGVSRRTYLVAPLLLSLCVACATDDTVPDDPLGSPDSKSDGWASSNQLGTFSAFEIPGWKYSLFSSDDPGARTIDIAAGRTSVYFWRWNGQAWQYLDRLYDRSIGIEAEGPVHLVAWPLGDTTVELGTPGVSLEGPYLYGHGGDVDGNGVTDWQDLELLDRALSGLVGAVPELDANRDGTLDELDFKTVTQVVDGSRRALLRADFFRADRMTGEPAEVEITGMHLQPGDELLIDGELHQLEQVVDEDDGSRTGMLWFEDELPAHGATVVLIDNNDDGTGPVDLDAVDPPCTETDAKTDPSELGPLPEGAPPPELGTPGETVCCVKKVVFRNPGLRSIRVFAQSLDGKLKARKNGQILVPGKSVTLKAQSPHISVSVTEEIGGDWALSGILDLNCESLADVPHIFTEDAEDIQLPDGSALRTREIVEVTEVEFGTCVREKIEGVSTGITHSVETKDNELYTEPRSHYGSGALATFRVPTATMNRDCTDYCWAQSVMTRIELLRAGERSWTTLQESDFHNDGPDTEARSILDWRDGSRKAAPWWCYKFQSIDRAGRLTLGDAPHLFQVGNFVFGGQKVSLAKGDRLRRTSFFRTTLVCYDDARRRSHGSFLWQITTTYTYDPDHLDLGGHTNAKQPQLTPWGNREPLAQSLLDGKRLRKHLKKKARNRL